VTGASRGLGLAFVEALLDDQASVETVIAACRAPGRAEALARLRDAHPHRLTIVELNVADEASIAAAAEEVGRRHPRAPASIGPSEAARQVPEEANPGRKSPAPRIVAWAPT